MCQPVWAGRLWPDPEVSPSSHQPRTILSAGFTPDMTLCQKSSMRSGGEKCWTETLSSVLSPVFGAFLPALNKTHVCVLSCQQSLCCFSLCNSINTGVRFEPTERNGYRAKAVWGLVPRNHPNQTAGVSHRQGCAPSCHDVHWVQVGMAKSRPRPPFPLLLPDLLCAFNLFWQI